MNEVEYWNGICGKSTTDDTSGELGINYHWPKLTHIVRNLLEYNFWTHNVFEIGTGLGLAAHAVRAAGGIKAYQGVDISPEFSEKAKEMFGLQVECCDLDKIPFDDNSFDVLWAFDVLEHIHPGKRFNAYDQLDRVLRPETIVLINNPLSKSKHDPEYEHDFSMFDIQDFTHHLGLQLKLLRKYTVGNSSYQWIVLERG